MKHIKFFDYRWPSHYDELISYYPRYYREVYEMVAILKWCGQWQGSIDESIEHIFNNEFIDTADEETIYRLEKFLNLRLHSSTRSLDARKRLVKAFFIGFGHLSASKLKAMIELFTDAEVNITFLPTDPQGNNTLDIEIERGTYYELYLDDIWLLIDRKIPAHLGYRMFVTYEFPIAVGSKDGYESWLYDWWRTGTLPDIATLGMWVVKKALTDPKVRNAVDKYHKAGIHKAGEIPRDVMLGQIKEFSSVSDPDVKSATFEYERTGLLPDIATLGQIIAESIVTDPEYRRVLDYYHKAGVHKAGTVPRDVMLGNIYTSPVTAEETAENALYEHDRTGIKPDIATIGQIKVAKSVTDPEITNAAYEQTQTDPENITGTIPDTTTFGQIRQEDIAVQAAIASAVNEYLAASADNVTGTNPDDATIGELISQKIAAQVSATSAAYQQDAAGESPDIATLGTLIASKIAMNEDVQNIVSEIRKADPDGTLDEGTIGKIVEATIQAMAEKTDAVTPHKKAASTKGVLRTQNIGAGATLTDIDMDYMHCGELPL